VLIELQNVVRSFPAGRERVVAVDDVTLRIPAGRFVCLYGSSGSGKSTLLNLIAGLDTPDSGRVCVDGQELSTMDEAARARMRLGKMGVIFQDDNLIDELTALENVALPLQALGSPFAEAVAQSRSALEKVGVGELADRHRRDMSGGQRQRVGIARGLVGPRVLLVADEPTGALDSANSRSLFGLMRALCADGVSAIVATHDPLARDFADSVYEIVDGHLHTPDVPAPHGGERA
jgi:putative ABC transport system ATP-binding protein